MKIIPYKKSFVICGDTKPHKDTIKRHGGKFNANLREDPEDSESDRFPGWLFFSREKAEACLAEITTPSKRLLTPQAPKDLVMKLFRELSVKDQEEVLSELSK